MESEYDKRQLAKTIRARGEPDHAPEVGGRERPDRVGEPDRDAGDLMSRGEQLTIAYIIIFLLAVNVGMMLGRR